MDDDFGFGGGRWGFGFGLFWRVASTIAGLMIALAIVAVLVLLVRYLIVATRAAQLYVDAHEPPRHVRPRETTPPAGGMTGGTTAAGDPVTPPDPVGDPTPPDTAATAKRPTRAPRTPKNPPSAL